MESDETLLEDELSAVGSILGEEDCEIDRETRTMTAWIPSRTACPPPYELRLRFGTEYPSVQPPQVEIRAANLSNDVKERTEDELYDMFLPGEVCVFNMCELLKERYEEAWGTQQDQEEDSSSSPADEPAVEEAGQESKDQGNEDERRMAAVMVTGEPYTERKSTFQAHVAPVACKADVEAMLSSLLRNSKIARASHNMWAFRISVPDKGTFLQDCDDDGETAAGSRLLHLLQVTKAEGVCAVVSRWFGGVHLGPSRFSIINNTARQLLVAEGYVAVGSSGKQQRGRGR